ncbi:MAG: bifunctional diaminohydroxyphosphoribosylaminopyrimidine deaminase/5-amino-6-(5-phosphoribosylamino)uracil reductase RibD [Oligosphaeraceae bacterium]|nr:bifunctional diaminohydroxyphosphoribosylaminopyrimidine deaminase/5-amino-6-(5-phosphoribosylamino)uracil reductase RibD [Oligosphaeraceae bacterium]
MSRHSDRYWLQQALSAAGQGWGLTSPNPMVGAVVVRNDRCLGRGYHHQAGGPHAEVLALAAAGQEAAGATLYVTLEPCSTYGRTPPCVDAIVKAGIRRVVIGCLDQNPAHNGRAVQILQGQGIEVLSGVGEQECLQLNEHFFWWISQGRPFVLLKMAMSLDGKIALPDGRSQWISGPEARSRVQRWRQLADAIMVGGDTARQDNPGLKVVEPAGWPRQPRVYVWSARALPADLRLMRENAVPPRCVKPQTQAQWLSFLRELGQEGCNLLLLEGGGELSAAALAAGVVNKVAFFLAPKLLLGRESIPVTGGSSVAELSQAIGIDDLQVERAGQDLLLTGWCRNVYRNS